MNGAARVAARVVACIALMVSGAEAGDPLRDFKTFETEHFVIHYYDLPGAPLEATARRVAASAEASHRVLVPPLDHAPDRKTIIVIVDDTDAANGFANVLPRNQVQLFATAPGSNTELDDHDDWLYALTAHEYTHILHLDTMTGLPIVFNSVFGKTWAPNQILPRWIIEGLAVYEESKRTSGGRNRGTRFDQFIRAAVLAGEDMRIDEISGAPRRFPRGNAVYVYGSHFLRYVFDRFGDDTAREMSHLGGDYPVPFSINRTIAKAVGQPFPELYDDWKLYLRDRYGMQTMAAERRGLAPGRKMTRSRETNHWAHYSPDGTELWWLQSDGYRESTLRAMPTGGDQSQARDVLRMDGIGPFDTYADGSLLFEQNRLYRREYSFQDIMRWDARTRTLQRMTTGRRARDPVLSPDERRIAFSMNQQSTSVLAVMDARPEAPATIVWQGEHTEQAYQPAWSPDGSRIAFSAWRKGGYRDILVIDLATGAIEEVTHDRAVDMAPEWSPDGRYLLFDSDRSTIHNVYAYDTTDRSLWQVSNVLGGAFFPTITPDGKTLAFEAAVGEGGYDLFEMPFDRERWLPARDYVDDRPVAPVVRNEEAIGLEGPRPYRPLESLAPQSWTLAYTLGDQKSFTVNTGGADAFGLHSYSLGVGVQLDEGDVNIGGSYSYNNTRLPVRFAFGRTVTERGGYRIDGLGALFREENWGLNFSSNIPFEVRPDSRWTLTFDYDFDYYRPIETPDLMLDPNDRTPVIPVTDYVQTGLGTRVSYSSVRNTAFSVGPVSGFDASLGIRYDHPLIGAKYRNFSASYTTTFYQKLWARTPALVLRANGALRSGDVPRTGTYGLGGMPTQSIVDAILDSTRVGSIGFLRGFPSRAAAGNQYHLLNVEYRQELFRIERGLQTLPFYLRRVHGALLSDTGAAWDTAFDASTHLKTALGAALRLDAYFGYFVPGTFEIGYSRGLTSGGIGQTWLLLTGTL